MERCNWANVNEISKEYHDNEWGIPVHDDYKLFEYLTYECLQCGLSFSTILKKREIIKECFDNFNYDKIAKYSDKDVKRILNTEGMLHSLPKIKAIINNAKCYQKVREEYGSFCNYLWNYSDNKTIIYEGHKEGKIPVSNELSQMISKDLKKKGFKFIGEIIIYSYLQACGIINDHTEKCPKFEEINKKYPTVKWTDKNSINKK